MQQEGGSIFQGSPPSVGGTGSSGNRWPWKETMELLKIRSEMETAFRDSPLKSPLWDVISRKLAELGYRRSGKKCREKFENVYKYHKRTKDARFGRRDGKSYRFFSQLEALRSSSFSSTPAPLPSSTTPVGSAMADTTSIEALQRQMALADKNAAPITVLPPSNATGQSTSANASSYSGTESEEEDLKIGSLKRKRKLRCFFEGFVQRVMDGQEAMLHRFLETMELKERERMIRDEAWRRQENNRITREHEYAAMERSAAVSRDNAIISLIQKITGQKISIPTVPTLATTAEMPTCTSMPLPPPPLISNSIVLATVPMGSSEAQEHNISSRWPKSEVHALIELRTEMEGRYQEAGLKALLWQDISIDMRRRGYNRSAKRCKEKWENINKYFKKVKESKKLRAEDAKTCPYFHKLDVLYRDKLFGLHNATAMASTSQHEDRGSHQGFPLSG